MEIKTIQSDKRVITVNFLVAEEIPSIGITRVLEV